MNKMTDGDVKWGELLSQAATARGAEWPANISKKKLQEEVMDETVDEVDAAVLSSIGQPRPMNETHKTHSPV